MQISRRRWLGGLTAIGLAVPLSAGFMASPREARAAESVNKSAPLYASLPRAVKHKGVLTVASDATYPPIESIAADNKTIIGLDPDIGALISQEIGVPLKFENVTFDSIIPGLIAKRYDLAMSAMTDTRERQKEIDFVDYLMVGEAIMLPPGNPKNVKTLADLCGLPVAIENGTTEVTSAALQSKKCVAEGKKPIKSIIFPNQNDVVLALVGGRAAAALADYSTAAYTAKVAHNGISVLPPYTKGTPYGIAFAKGNMKLAVVFQKALERAKASGAYAKVLNKYGEGLGTIKEFTINGG